MRLNRVDDRRPPAAPVRRSRTSNTELGTLTRPTPTGRVSRGVVRVGDTVRRPMPADSDYVHGLLAHLEHCGFVGAPRFLGVDSRGREIVSYIEGTTLPHNG